MSETKEKKKLNIALVAHDARKAEMLEWVAYNYFTLKEHNLYATGTTGTLIEETGIPYIVDGSKHTGYLKVEKLLSGPLGGDMQIGAMIAEGKIDVLIFLCDNLIAQGHKSDVEALTRVTSVYNIPFAMNRTTADMIITSSLFADPGYVRIVPSIIEKYNNRDLDL